MWTLDNGGKRGDPRDTVFTRWCSIIINGGCAFIGSRRFDSLGVQIPVLVWCKSAHQYVTDKHHDGHNRWVQMRKNAISDDFPKSEKKLTLSAALQSALDS
jgi:hypothetical protein